MAHKVFLGINPPEYHQKERDAESTTSLPISTFCRENLSLAGCSSAEPASVSVQQGKSKNELMLYLLLLTRVVYGSRHYTIKTVNPIQARTVFTLTLKLTLSQAQALTPISGSFFCLLVVASDHKNCLPRHKNS